MVAELTDGPLHYSGNEAALAQLARTHDPALRDQVVEANLGLAYRAARHFANRGEPVQDLDQVAALALVKAVDGFDPSHNASFSTYATHTIVGELKRHFRDKGWIVRPPRSAQELYLAVVKSTDKLTQASGRPPTVQAIATDLATTQEAVLAAIEAGQAYRSTSLDAPLRQEGTLATMLGDDDPDMVRSEDRQVLAQAIDALPQQQRRILRMRFIGEMTQTEIAKRVGVSQMQISRLINQAVEQLRTSFIE